MSASPVPATPAATPTAAAVGARPARTPTPSPQASPAQAAGATTATWRATGSDLATLTLADATFDGRRVQLARNGDRYSASGRATSPVREAGFAFDTAVLSWNADAPAGTSLKLELRVRGQGPDDWSGWYALGTWGAGGGASVSGQADARGTVDVDTLKLKGKAWAFQYRATLSTTNPAVTPALRLVAVNYADRSRPLVGPKLPSVALGRDLDVPRYSQLDQEPSLAWSVCSPTSLTMVMRYWGVGLSVPETIKGVRDAATGIYGNWPLNTAYAASQGLEAYVDRFYAVEQLESEIAAGRPVIASVRWRAGELDNASVASAESGHLIVVRGFTAGGDVIVNDPAGRGDGVRRVYKRQQFANIWLREGGVVYLLRPRSA